MCTAIEYFRHLVSPTNQPIFIVTRPYTCTNHFNMVTVCGHTHVDTGWHRQVILMTSNVAASIANGLLSVNPSSVYVYTHILDYLIIMTALTLMLFSLCRNHSICEKLMWSILNHMTFDHRGLQLPDSNSL